METRHFIGAHVKAVSGKDETAADAPYGWVEGIANAFEVDRYGDLVLPSALAEAWPKFKLNPVLSFGHGIDGNPVDGTLPAGSVLSMSQDQAGSTHFRARWANTPDAQKVRALYADGDMRAFSIHFLPYGDSLEVRQPTAEEVQRFPGVQRVITKLELIEIACAVVPVNAGSLMTGAKSINAEGLRAPRHLQGETMKKSVLTPDHRKAIDEARKKYELHVKAMEELAGALDELSASKEGQEGDHEGLCARALEAHTKSHKAMHELGESVKAMHKAIGGNEPEGDEPEEDEPEGDEDGSEPLPEGDEKALLEGFSKAMK